MAATTITRESMVDGTTVWNVTRIGSAIYDKIDALIAGAVTFGGVLSSEGFGNHTFSAGGTGANQLLVRNTTSGTGNFATLAVGNNASATLARLIAFSSTYTTSGTGYQSGVLLEANGAGGLNLAAMDAAGVIRCYTGGAYERVAIDANGNLKVGYGLWLTGSYDQTITGTQALDSSGQYAPVIRLTSCTSTPKISACTAGNDGDVKVLINVSGVTCTVQHNGGGPGSRIYVGNGADGTLADKEAVMLIYDAGTSSWYEVGYR